MTTHIPAPAPAPTLSPTPVPVPTPVLSPIPVSAPIPVPVAKISSVGVSYEKNTPGYLAALAIIRTFETGSPTGGFNRIADHPADKGGLSYGWFQAADKPDTLDRVLEEYIRLGGSMAEQLRPFVNVLRVNKGSGNEALKSYLGMAGSDPLMQQAQNTIFFDGYGKPAINYARKIGLNTPLGFAVILDTHVQGGKLSDLRSKFKESPPADGGDEAIWIRRFCEARKAWLESLSSLANKTGYRPRTFIALLDQKNLSLQTPFSVLFSTSSKVIPRV